MIAFVVFLGIIFGGVKLLASANNISDSEAMDKYSGKLFVVAIIVLLFLYVLLVIMMILLIKVLLNEKK